MSLDSQSSNNDGASFGKMLEDINVLLSKEYLDEKGIPNDLGEGILQESGDKIISGYAHLANMLYKQCVANIQQGRFFIVFNSIWSLYEQTLVELILIERGREFLKNNTNESPDPHDSPLIKFIAAARLNIEYRYQPADIISEAFTLQLITEQEREYLLMIKKNIRLTASHSKIKQFVKICSTEKIIPPTMLVRQGEGEESLRHFIETREHTSDTKLIEVSADGEMFYSVVYESVIEGITPMLLVYFYHFSKVKGPLFNINRKK